LYRANRWNLSSEVRAFALHNFQHFHRRQVTELTGYDGEGQGAEVTLVRNLIDTSDRNATATVLGSDIRALAAYEVTRDIKLEAGLQFLGLFSGIGRGININKNTEAVVMVGTTFGFSVNY
jgi:hypothetical protein